MLQPLVDAQEYAQALGVEFNSAGLVDDLIAGELAVANWVGGRNGPTVSSLRERLLSLDIVVRVSNRVLELSDGPLTSLTSIRFDGTLITLADYGISANYWSLICESYFPRFITVTAQFVAGWRQDNLPADLRRAIIEAAASRRGKIGTGGIASESLGDYSVSYSQGQVDNPALSVVAQQLSNSYRRAML